MITASCVNFNFFTMSYCLPKICLHIYKPQKLRKCDIILRILFLPDIKRSSCAYSTIEYSGVKSITCPAIGNHHSGQTEISIPEMEITNILS